jgi:hypothetical protein
MGICHAKSRNDHVIEQNVDAAYLTTSEFCRFPFLEVFLSCHNLNFFLSCANMCIDYLWKPMLMCTMCIIFQLMYLYPKPNKAYQSLLTNLQVIRKIQKCLGPTLLSLSTYCDLTLFKLVLRGGPPYFKVDFP